MKQTLAVCMLFSVSLCLAQKETDSLYALLPLQKLDTNKVILLADLAFSFWSHNPADGEAYADEALSLATSLNFERGKAKALNAKGVLKWALSDFEAAIFFYRQSLAISEKNGDQKSASQVYNNIAMIYSRLGNYEDALFFYKKVLDVDIATRDSIGIGLSYNNMGLAYLDQKSFKQSLDVFTKALTIYRTLNDYDKIAQTLSNLGLNYAKQNAYTQALKYYEESESLYQINGLKRGYSILCTNIGDTYVALKKYETARTYFEKSLRLSEELKSTERISESLLSMAKLDSTLGNYKNAYQYFWRYDTLQTSIDKQKHARELNQFRVQFAIKEKEAENELLRSEASLQTAYLQQQRFILIGVVILLALAIGLALLFYFYYRNKTTANRELKELNEQITEQQEKLRVAYDEIRAINENLEQIVQERSNRIEFQNRQLTEYAYFNAHKVRGPLARILGIVSLLKVNSDWLQSDNLLEKLDESSKELDNSIRDINSILDSE